MDIFLRNFYSSLQHYDALKETWFDEGPDVLVKIIPINSSSIETKEIDIFRQGVELTQNKHNLGGFKISAGTPGHIIQPHAYGDPNLDISQKDYFKELNYFDPVAYIRAMEQGIDLEKLYTFPIILPNTNTAENYDMNAVIEPLTIRAVASFFSIDFPYEAHSVKGSLSEGNTDVFYSSSDQIVSADYRQTRLNKPKLMGSGSVSYINENRSYINDDYFLDASEDLVTPEDGGALKQIVAYFDSKLNKIDSFDDTTNYIRDMGIKESTHGYDMVVAIEAMTNSSDENYIPPHKKSNSTGFVYDNVGIAGVDSIAFGGLSY